MQTLTLLHWETFPIGLYADELTRESIAPSQLDDLDQLSSNDSSALRVVVVDRGSANGRKRLLRLDARTAVVGVGLDEQPRWLADDGLYLHLPDSPSTAVLLRAFVRTRKEAEVSAGLAPSFGDGRITYRPSAGN